MRRRETRRPDRIRSVDLAEALDGPAFTITKGFPREPDGLPCRFVGKPSETPGISAASSAKNASDHTTVSPNAV